MCTSMTVCLATYLCIICSSSVYNLAVMIEAIKDQDNQGKLVVT